MVGSASLWHLRKSLYLHFVRLFSMCSLLCDLDDKYTQINFILKIRRILCIILLFFLHWMTKTRHFRMVSCSNQYVCIDMLVFPLKDFPVLTLNFICHFITPLCYVWDTQNLNFLWGIWSSFVLSEVPGAVGMFISTGCWRIPISFPVTGNAVSNPMGQMAPPMLSLLPLALLEGSEHHPRTPGALEELFMRNMTHMWVSSSEVEVKSPWSFIWSICEPRCFSAAMLVHSHSTVFI